MDWEIDEYRSRIRHFILVCTVVAEIYFLSETVYPWFESLDHWAVKPLQQNGFFYFVVVMPLVLLSAIGISMPLSALAMAGLAKGSERHTR